MQKHDREITNGVAKLLREAGIPFERDVIVGGLRLDFLIRTPDRKTIAIDVKSWSKHQGFRSRAAHQSSLYEKLRGIDKALVYVEALERSSVPEGVVNPDTLVKAVLDMFPTPPSHTTGEKGVQREVAKEPGGQNVVGPIARPTRQTRVQVFAAMPFDRKYDDVYIFAMSRAAEVNGAVCERVDTVQFSGDIVDQIQSMIRQSKVMIADLSEANPNVLYEVGYAHALKIPTIHICSTPLSQLPFDVSHWNTLEYKVGQVHLLQEPLTQRVKAALNN